MILLEWLGADGSVWDLRNGPVRLGLGAQGFGLLPLTTFSQDNGIADGERDTGWRLDPADFKLPLKKGYPGWTETDWAILEEAWTRAILPHKTGTLRATGPRGTVRTVAARVTSDGPRTMEFDPSEVHEEDIDYTFHAPLPWWIGGQQVIRFGVGAAQPFYGGSGFGPPFYISAANSSGSQVIQNPGHVDAWGVWTITGPVASFTITQGGKVVSGAPALAAGEKLVIDTRPGKKSATRYDAAGNPTPWTPNLTSADWRPVPAGSSAQLQVALVGSGAAELAIAPQYFTPW